MTELSPRDPVLEMHGISKTYGAVRALRGVSFSLYRAEVVGLVGDNGAGKSTLSKVISGITKPDAGEILIEGVPHVFEGANDARAAGIETVFQNLAVVPTLDMPANMYLGRERFKGGFLGRFLKIMDRASMYRSAEEGFHKLGLKLPDLGTKVGALSGGQRQAVAIARAVLWGSKIVVLDEPTAALGVHQTEMVLSFIEKLRDHGVTVVFISHNMQNVMRVADRVIVMRLGQKTFEGETGTLSPSRLVALITGASEVDVHV